MKKILITMLIIWCSICISIETAYTQAEEDAAASQEELREEPQGELQEEPKDIEGLERELEYQKRYRREECRPGDRRCKVDRVLDELEREISEMAAGYKSGSMWDSPRKIPPDAGAGKKFASYVLSIPTYAVRLVTWPVALVSDKLIQKGVIRKVVDVVSNDERTRWVYPKLELGFGSGFGGGVGLRQYDLFNTNYELGGSYSISINMNQTAYLEFGTSDFFYFFDKPIGFKFRTDVIHRNDTSYYGRGINASRGDKAKYGVDLVKAGGWFGYEVLPRFTIQARSFFEWNYSESGSGGPTVETAFPSDELVAFNRDLGYLKLGFSLLHDDRDSTVIPERGGIRKISFDRYQGLGTTKFDYNEYTLELAQFIPALMPRHVLVLRTEWKYQQQTGSEGIPFYKLAKFDVNSNARGFDYGRYADRGRAVFNVEYRFPVWRFIDGQLFFDTGRVFHSPGDFSFKHFKFDGGGGIRFRTSDFFLMRFQVAYGGEGVKFLLKTSQAF